MCMSFFCSSLILSLCVHPFIHDESFQFLAVPSLVIFLSRLPGVNYAKRTTIVGTTLHQDHICLLSIELLVIFSKGDQRSINVERSEGSKA